jgi:hypothetical protein
MRPAPGALLVSALLATFLGACSKRLPDQVPYEVHLMADGKNLNLDAYAGAKAYVGEDEVGAVAFVQSKLPHILFTRPKSAGVPEKITLKLATVCGVTPLVIEVDAPYARKDGKLDEGVLATRLESAKAVELYTKVSPLRAAMVYVDWGDAKDPLEIGEHKIAGQPKELRVVTEGCPDSQEVRVGGSAAGTLDAKSPATLVSLVPGRCYRWAAVAYGNASDSRPAMLLHGARVYALPGKATYVFKRAPATTTVYDVGGSNGGVVSTELVADECK